MPLQGKAANQTKQGTIPILNPLKATHLLAFLLSAPNLKSQFPFYPNNAVVCLVGNSDVLTSTYFCSK
jgi:hypothetical protein